MRKHLLTATALVALFGGSAVAADMSAPVYKAPPAPAPVWSWTGFYIGGQVGATWGTAEASLNANNNLLPGLSGPLAQTEANGFLAGGLIGLNWQFASWGLIGIEGDFNWTNLKGSSPCLIIGGCHVSHDWIATATGRFGVIYDRALLYVKGGAAWTKPSYSVDFSGVGAVATSSSSGDTRVGWVFGTGIEYAFTPSWSAKIEYNYIDFGHKDVAFDAGGGATFSASVHEKVHLVKAGLNYKFNWGGSSY
jgi:outer membrane immunogenic protein